ncbi:MAG: long-chain-fatty-acid--CoA ligase [Promethearchaeota archaeon]|jgi:long-chain acyl-CoA synthetase
MSEDPYESKPWLKSYDEGVPHEINFPEMNIYEFLDNSEKEFRGRTAIWFMKNKISYKKFKDVADRLATALVNMGVKKGDVVALMLPNMPQFMFGFYGIQKAGGIVTACSVLHTEHELAYQLNDSGAEIIIAWDAQLEKINNIKERTRLRHIIITNIFDYAPMANPLGQKEPPNIAGTIQLLTLVNKTKPDPPSFETNSEDIAVLQYTGGTTGLPKGAMLTHGNLVANCIQMYEWTKAIGERGKETALTTLPLFHIYGMQICMNLFIFNGFTIALHADPRDQKGLFEVIKAVHPSFFPGVPTMYLRLLERDDLEDYAKDLRSIKVCNTGAAPMPPEVLKEFEERTGARVVEGYGMTETSPATHVNPYMGTRKIGSVGLAVPNTEYKIVDISDYTKILPQGESGEIIIKGPQVMKGYWNKPEETANQLKDGWLLTGDIGRMDEDGYLFIVDRKKDMINISGFKVYPREVEDVLFENEAVENAAVIGIPDPDISGNEKVKAYIVLKDGYQETDEMKNEIKEFLRKNVAPYKVPKLIEFRKELPETLVGKVLRKELKDIEARKRGEEV